MQQPASSAGCSASMRTGLAGAGHTHATRYTRSSRQHGAYMQMPHALPAARQRSCARACYTVLIMASIPFSRPHQAMWPRLPKSLSGSCTQPPSTLHLRRLWHCAVPIFAHMLTAAAAVLAAHIAHAACTTPTHVMSDVSSLSNNSLCQWLIDVDLY